MFCKKCGAQLPDDAKFCKKCGEPVKDNQKKDENNQGNVSSKKETEKKSKKVKGQKWFFVVIAVLVLGMCLLDEFGITDISSVAKNFNSNNYPQEEKEPYEIEHPDADEYYKQNSKSVIEIGAVESDDKQTETEAYKEIIGRGFDEYSITAEYSIDGDYYEATEIVETSKEYHPMYQTFYVSLNDNIWSVWSVNGTIMAIPISYNMQSDVDVQVVLSEKKTITSYDSKTNKFYERVPIDTEMKVVVVERIDAETLDKFTAEVINE